MTNRCIDGCEKLLLKNSEIHSHDDAICLKNTLPGIGNLLCTAAPRILEKPKGAGPDPVLEIEISNSTDPINRFCTDAPRGFKIKC
jgi:hypothetical protein